VREGTIASTYANGDILGCGKKPVDQYTHEGGVEAIFNREGGELGIGHRLGDDDGADGDACN
jgi:hypothetical protein